MCIQWCCKNCPGKLTILSHQFARERCNIYHIALSNNSNQIECPNGPWEIRRAYHRHPSRGTQTCDDCKERYKNDKNTAQRNARAALGKQPGPIPPFELEVPESFRGNADSSLERVNVDRMRASRESSGIAKGYLPLNKLDREGASGSATFGILDLEAKPAHLAPTFGQRMSGEHRDRVGTALVEGVSRQQTRHLSTSSVYNQTNTRSEGTPPSTKHNMKSTIERPDSRTVERPVAHENNQYIYDTRPGPGTDTGTGRNNKKILNAGGCASRTTHHHQHSYGARPGLSDEYNHTSTKYDKNSPREPDRSRVDCNSDSVARSSSPQLTRNRPWDL